MYTFTCIHIEQEKVICNFNNMYKVTTYSINSENEIYKNRHNLYTAVKKSRNAELGSCISAIWSDYICVLL